MIQRSNSIRQNLAELVLVPKVETRTPASSARFRGLGTRMLPASLSDDRPFAKAPGVRQERLHVECACVLPSFMCFARVTASAVADAMFKSGSNELVEPRVAP